MYAPNVKFFAVNWGGMMVGNYGKKNYSRVDSQIISEISVLQYGISDWNLLNKHDSHNKPQMHAHNDIIRVLWIHFHVK